MKAHKQVKDKALQDPKVRAEYDRLGPEFDLRHKKILVKRN